MDRPNEFLAWAVEMFGPIALDRNERIARFTEEAIELAHAEGMSLTVLQRIIDRFRKRNGSVASRPRWRSASLGDSGVMPAIPSGGRAG